MATRAQLSASLPPAVKYISLVFAPRDRAMVSLAWSVSYTHLDVYKRQAYVYAGIATEKNQGTFGLHSSSFMLEESVIPGMAAVFAQFAVDFLEKGGF